jgi:hypothetical protein
MTASPDDVSGMKNLHRSDGGLMAKNAASLGGISESGLFDVSPRASSAEQGNRRARRGAVGITVVTLCQQS